MSRNQASPTPHRIVTAPQPSNPRLRSTMLDVECGEDETVEWHWTDTPEGRFVSGYNIVQRLET